MIEIETLGRALIAVGVVAAMFVFACGAVLLAQGKSRYRQIRNAEGRLVGLVDREQPDPKRLKAS